MADRSIPLRANGTLPPIIVEVIQDLVAAMFPGAVYDDTAGTVTITVGTSYTDEQARDAAAAALRVATGSGLTLTVDDAGDTITIGTSGLVAVADVTDVTAADIPFTPNGSIAATTVQLAIQEVRDEYPTPGSSYTDEQAQDAIAALIAAGTSSGITFTYDDGGNRLSAVVTAGTGGSSVDSISGGDFTTVFTSADSIYGGTF